MTTLIERVFSAVFGTIGSDFINTLSRGADTIYDFVYVKVFGLPFIVLGARQTGKTTLIEWMRANVSRLEGFNPEPTPPGGDRVGTFSAQVGAENMRLKPVRDVGGEYEMWETDWVELFREARPRGIVFMIDHTDVLNHKDALNFIMNLIEEEAEARNNLKAFLLLVNKSDLWQDDQSLDKLMAQYSNEIKRLRNQAERLGYQTWIHSTSVIHGVGVDGALQNFFNAIRPRPRHRAN